VMFTNGSVIHRQLDALRLLSRGDRVIVSVEGRDAPTYEAIRRGLSWERLLENVELFRKNRQAGVSLVARITACQEIRGDMKEVRRFWEARTDRVRVETEKPLVRSIVGHYRHRSCDRPAKHLTVRYDGELALCCIDYDASVGLGNIRSGARLAWETSALKRHCGHDMCQKCLWKFVPEKTI